MKIGTAYVNIATDNQIKPTDQYLIVYGAGIGQGWVDSVATSEAVISTVHCHTSTNYHYGDGEFNAFVKGAKLKQKLDALAVGDVLDFSVYVYEGKTETDRHIQSFRVIRRK